MKVVCKLECYEMFCSSNRAPESPKHAIFYFRHHFHDKIGLARNCFFYRVNQFYKMRKGTQLKYTGSIQEQPPTREKRKSTNSKNLKN